MVEYEKIWVIRLRTIVMMVVLSQLLLSWFLFAAYITEFQTFNLTTILLTTVFLLSVLATLPIVLHVLAIYVKSVSGKLSGSDRCEICGAPVEVKTYRPPLKTEEGYLLDEYECDVCNIEQKHFLKKKGQTDTE